jgi:hypothetical protein
VSDLISETFATHVFETGVSRCAYLSSNPSDQEIFSFRTNECRKYMYWMDRPHLVWVIPVCSTFSMCLSTSSTGSTGALHDMKITRNASLSDQGIIPWGAGELGKWGIINPRTARRVGLAVRYVISRSTRMSGPVRTESVKRDIPNRCSFRGRLIAASSFATCFSKSSSTSSPMAPSSESSWPSSSLASATAVSGQSSDAT